MKFRSGDGRLGEVRQAAGIPVGIAGNRGRFTAFALGADISALLRKGAAEALGGQSDIFSSFDEFTPKGGADTPVGESGRALYPESGRFS